MTIICTGSIAYDYLMTFPGRFQDHILPEHLSSISLSFLVDSMVKQRGGVGPNIAYTLALLGLHPRVIGTAGQDFGDYRAWLEKRGVDTSGVKIIEDKFTASFFATTDVTNSQIASFYPGAMADAAQVSLRDAQVSANDLVMISPTDTAAMTLYVAECKALGIPYVYDPSQQVVRMEGKDLRTGVEGAKFLFVNEYEFELLQKHTQLSKEDIIRLVPHVVVTLGADGAVIYTDQKEYRIPVAPVEKIQDPTGVGDAFRGGFLTGFSKGFDWDICGKMGSLAAAYCLEQKGTQNHQYTPAEFVARFRRHFDDHGVLDQLS